MFKLWLWSSKLSVAWTSLSASLVSILWIFIKNISSIRQNYLQSQIIRFSSNSAIFGFIFNFHHTFLGFRFFFFLFDERTSESLGLTSGFLLHLALHWTNRLEGGFPSIQFLSSITQPISSNNTSRTLFNRTATTHLHHHHNLLLQQNSVSQSLSASNTSCSSSTTSFTCKTS
jgi:hypothetical protein